MRSTDSVSVSFSNFGKLDGSNILIKPFTSFCGDGNTGKSFCLKLIYSLFNAVSYPGDSEQIAQRINENLVRNFQIPNVRDLKNDPYQSAQIRVEGLFDFHIFETKTEFVPGDDYWWAGENLSDTVYLGSPDCWKLKNMLETARINPKYRHTGRIELNSVPEYAYDTFSALLSDSVGHPAFPDIQEQLVKAMGGKLVIDATGGIAFIEKGKHFPLSVVSDRIINLGILELLLDRKIITKNTILFVDSVDHTLYSYLFEIASSGGTVIFGSSISNMPGDAKERCKQRKNQFIIYQNFFPLRRNF